MTATAPPATPSGTDAAASSTLAGWPAAVSAAPAAEQDAEAVRALLRLARGIAASRRRVDLHGLDRMVGRLCARCLDLPPPDGRRIALRLTELQVEIDSLNATMTTLPP